MKNWTRSEIDELLLSSDGAVERGIIRLFQTNSFRDMDRETGSHFAQWLLGLSGKNKSVYPAKPLKHPRAVRRFGKRCLRGESPMDHARRITLLHSETLTNLANTDSHVEPDESTGELETNPYALCMTCQQSHHVDEDHVCEEQQEDDNSAGPLEPALGTWAATARAMADVFPEGPGNGMDWDDWKDMMKEKDL